MGFRWTPERIGAALCLAAAASFALQPLLVKLAFDSGASVVSVGALRFALAAAVLGLLARRSLAVAPLRILLPPFVLGLTLYGLETGLFFASLERIDVSLASLLMCSYPAIVVAGAVLLGRERASKRRVVALGRRARRRAARARGRCRRRARPTRYRARARGVCRLCVLRPRLRPLAGDDRAARARSDALRRRGDRVRARRRGNRLACGGCASACAAPGRRDRARCDGAPDRRLPRRCAAPRPVSRDDSRHGRAAADDRPLSGRLRRAADPGAAPRRGARRLGRRDRPGPGSDETTAGSRGSFRRPSRHPTRSSSRPSPSENRSYEKPWTFGHYAAARTEPM